VRPTQLALPLLYRFLHRVRGALPEHNQLIT